MRGSITRVSRKDGSGCILAGGEEVYFERSENENVLVARIRTDQQAVFEMPRSGESGLDKPPLEKAQKIGR